MTELLGDGRKHLPDIVAVGDVGLHQKALPAQFFYLVRRSHGIFLMTYVVHRHINSVLRQPNGNSPADPTGSSGNKRCFPLQIKHETILCNSMNMLIIFQHNSSQHPAPEPEKVEADRIETRRGNESRPKKISRQKPRIADGSAIAAGEPSCGRLQPERTSPRIQLKGMEQGRVQRHRRFC
ncbi:MAG: hypothetical protein ACD_75C00296G0001, partial [uncultured bacterium]